MTALKRLDYSAMLATRANLEGRGLMKVAQFFTPHGVLGVILFLAGNCGHGLAWFLMLAHPPIAPWHVILAGLSALASLVSVPMMLIGREYFVTITHIPRDAFR